MSEEPLHIPMEMDELLGAAVRHALEPILSDLRESFTNLPPEEH